MQHELGPSHMKKDDLSLLTAQPSDKSLDRLESDVWERVEACKRAHQSSRLIMSYQAGAVAVVLFAAAAVGTTGTLTVVTETATVQSPGAELTPSALLLGIRP
jgi:hypothetical protein